MTKDLSYAKFIYYSDSVVCINLINDPIEKYDMIYSVLIQDIKQLLHQINVMVSHTLKEGNYCTDFMTKLEASSNIIFLMSRPPLVL